MKLTIMTADAAQVDNSGKVHALGLGWDRITTPLPPVALILFVDISSEEVAPQIVELSGTILDQDDNPVRIKSEAQALNLKTSLDINRKPGRAIAIITLGPGMPLEPGHYGWSISIDGSEIRKKVPFEVVTSSTAPANPH